MTVHAPWNTNAEVGIPELEEKDGNVAEDDDVVNKTSMRLLFPTVAVLVE